MSNRQRDTLLHEVATALRDLSTALVAPGSGINLERCQDNAEAVLTRLVEREGDLIPIYGEGMERPLRWAGR